MIREIIKEYNLNKKLNPDTIEELYKPANQISLIDFLNTEPNREFALYILNDAIVKRENTDVSFDLEDLIFASFLLAIHKNPEDFIHVFANIMEGRTVSQKKNLSVKIITELKSMFTDVLVISINIRDFDKATYCNKSMV